MTIAEQTDQEKLLSVFKRWVCSIDIQHPNIMIIGQRVDQPPIRFEFDRGGALIGMEADLG